MYAQTHQNDFNFWNRFGKFKFCSLIECGKIFVFQFHLFILLLILLLIIDSIGSGNKNVENQN